MVDAIPYASGVPQNLFQCKLLITKMLKPERSPMRWFILFREREPAVPFSGRLEAQFVAGLNALLQMANQSSYPAGDLEVCGQPIGRRLAEREGRFLFRCRS